MMRFSLALIIMLFSVSAFAADSDDAYAHYAQAGKYMTGNGVPQDDKLAAVELRKAADMGLAIAQYYLAKAYADGKGVAQDKVQAYFWVLLASQGGDKFILDYRDELQGKLTNEQVVEIQRRVAAWKPSATP